MAMTMNYLSQILASIQKTETRKWKKSKKIQKMFGWSAKKQKHKG